MNLILLLVFLLSSEKIHCGGREEEKRESEILNHHSGSPSRPTSFLASHNPAKFSSFLWDEEEEEDEEDEDEGETEILVFEGGSSREGNEARDGDDSANLPRSEISDSAKTKRNSLVEQTIESKAAATGHSSLPKAAALQSGPQSLPIGSLNPHNRANIFQGFNFARSPSCGMCSRERNLCQIISGIFTRSPLPYGYSLVTPIPAGVCNISIVEIKPSKNFFALRRKDGAYVLNGNWKIQAAGNYGISGTLFSYSSSDGTRGEKLEAPGPLLEPLDLMIIYQSPNPGIKYEYRVPINDIRNQQNPQSRILPAIPNHNGIGNTYNLEHNKYPSNVANVPGSSTLHPSRTSVSGTNRGVPQNPIYSQLPTNILDNTKPITTVNKWSPPYLSPGVNRVPINTGHIAGNGLQPPGYNQGSGSTFPSHLSPSGTQLYNGGLGKRPDTRFKSERFPGVLNTDPRTIPNRPLSFQGNSSVPSPAIKRPGISFTSRTPSTGSNGGPSLKINNHIHKTRHKHGSRTILPGPAVGGNGISPLTPAKETGFHSGVHIKTPGQKISNKNVEISSRKQQKRRRKKGKKRRGKKRKNRFHWAFKGLSKCTRACGGGNQTSLYSCERRRKGKVVADRLCEGVPKPTTKVLSCNLKPCPAKWVPGEWGECSVTCGIGVRTRPLLCKQEVSVSLTMMVPEGACLAPKEGNTTQICTLEECPSLVPKWKVGEWSHCSTECGVGIKKRQVDCIVMGNEVDEDECSTLEAKPIEEESCDMGSCATNTWFFSAWSNQCSNTCGEGTQSRIVTCITKLNDKEDSSCEESLRPNETRSCVGHAGCGGQWFSGPWSECSVSCGSGIETRTLTCLEKKKNKWVMAPEEKCRHDLKPSLSRVCTLNHCMPEWFTSDWSECSVSCGGDGIQEREVKCLDSSLNTSPNCYNDSRPDTRRPCGKEECQKDISKEREQTLVESEKSNSEDETDTITELMKGKKDKQKIDQNTETETGVKSTKGNDKNEDNERKEKKDNRQRNELEVIREVGSSINDIPDKDAQGDESVSEIGDAEKIGQEEELKEEAQRKEKGEKEIKENNEKEMKKRISNESDAGLDDNEVKQTCMDRIKNCHLVFRARLCRLKYYNKLCCLTCQSSER